MNAMKIDLRPPPVWLRCLVAALLVGVGFGARLLLAREITPEMPYLTFFPVVVIAAMYGGFLAGLLATVLSVLLAIDFFIAPFGQLGAESQGDRLKSAMFLIGCIVVALFGEFLLRYRVRLRKQTGTLKRLNMALQSEIAERKRSEAFMREREEQLRLFVEHAPAAIAMFDQDMRYLAVSRRWSEDFGLVGRELLGRSHYEIFPEIPERWKQIHRRCLGGMVERADEEPFTRSDGTVQWLRWEIRPWHKASGAIGGIVIFSEDVTARKLADKALNESEERFRMMADSIPQLAWIARPDGSVFWYNKRWYEYTGTTPGQVEGWGWQNVHDPVVLPTVLEQWGQSIATGNPFDMVTPLRGADGEFRPFLTRAVPLLDSQGGIVQWFGTSTDIAEQKRLESVLEEAKEEAERANQAKSAFLANMSHEIRTPMNGILGFAQLLAASVQDKDSREYSRLIIHSGKVLLGIINDILDLSKVEAGKVELKSAPFSLRDVLDSTLKPMRMMAAEKGLRLRYSIVPEVPDLLVGDSGRLMQVMTNLVGNAIKFTEEGTVEISVSADEATTPQTPRLRFAVKDTGIGISGDRLPHVFEPFTQLGTSAHVKYGGTGLGLAISKHLVEMMGGGIWAESEEGRGSTFVFTAGFELSQEAQEAIPR